MNEYKTKYCHHGEIPENCPDCVKTTFDQDFKEKVKEIKDEIFSDHCAICGTAHPRQMRISLDELTEFAKRILDEMGKEG